MAAVAVEMSALSAFSVAILGSHQHSAFSSIVMIATIAMMICSMPLRVCVGDMVVVIVIQPSVLATINESSVVAMMATLVLVCQCQQEMTVVAAIGSWAGDRCWQQIAVMAFLGTRGDCCMNIAVAKGAVELSVSSSLNR
jgi:hypothetical protein